MRYRLPLMILCLSAVFATSDAWANRYYSLETGRFITRDPVGYQDGPNIYEYAKSSPIGKADRLGLMSCEKLSGCVWWAMKNDLGLQRLMRDLDRFGCVWIWQCRDCGGSYGLHTSDWGYYVKPGKKAQWSWGFSIVKIDPNVNTNCYEVRDTLKHELVHALQYCRGTLVRTQGNDCFDCLCYEAEAYFKSGDCGPNGTYRDPGESEKDCVVRGAKNSCDDSCEDVAEEWQDDYFSRGRNYQRCVNWALKGKYY